MKNIFWPLWGLSLLLACSSNDAPAPDPPGAPGNGGQGGDGQGGQGPQYCDCDQGGVWCDGNTITANVSPYTGICPCHPQVTIQCPEQCELAGIGAVCLVPGYACSVKDPKNTGDLVDHPMSLHGMVVDADSIYEVVDHVDNQVSGQPIFFERVGRQTGTRTELFQEPAVEAGSKLLDFPDLWQSGSWIIAGRRGSGVVEAIPKQGGEAMTLWSKPFDEIVTSDTEVFLLAKGTTTKLLSKQALAAVPGAVTMAISPSGLVVATPQELVHVPLDGGTPSVWASGFTAIQAVVVDENATAYVADGDSIIKVSAAGKRTPIVTGQLTPYRLALVGSSQLAFIDRGKVLEFSPVASYYKTWALSGLFVVSRDGGNPAALACLGADHLSASGGALFWTFGDSVSTLAQP